jgi:Mce-associated membrane protein
MAIDVDAAESQLTALADHDSDVDQVDGDREAGEAPDSAEPAVAQRRTAAWLAMAVSIITALTLAGLGGWLGYRAYQAHRAQQQRDLMLQAGRQAALNLTTINYTEADADMARIIDSATGTFRDDFQTRANAFVDVVKRAQSQSQGTITEAGLESDDNNQAQVLVAVSVKTTIAGTPEPQPRAWRMRINVQRVGNDIKVSNVVFVP